VHRDNFKREKEVNEMSEKDNKKRYKSVSYAKWGYVFILPFFLAFAVFQLIPMISTVFYSFFEYYRSGLKIIGPTFVGLDNYKELIQSDFLKYTGNTLLLWIAGFIPQIVVSLILAAWFSDEMLKIKGKQFFKTVIYMPNLIMASAFSMLFFALFSNIGPVNGFLISSGIAKNGISFFTSVGWTRALIALMNFLMWFGNTTILLMAGMLGIDSSLYEAAQVDGATASQVFFKITMPILRPIFVYVLITSLIGGLQMFDVPQVLTAGDGTPARQSMTLIMYLNKHLYSKNYGMAGALSVFLFIITGILSLIVFKFSVQDNVDEVKPRRNRNKG
jgi:multiple sugar transport system permease protein